jgi:hypothetical protein
MGARVGRGGDKEENIMSREDIQWGIAHSEWAKGTLLKEWRAKIYVPEYLKYSEEEVEKWTQWLQNGGSNRIMGIYINGDPSVLTPEEEKGWIFYLSWAAYHKPLNEELKHQFWESHAEDVFLNGSVPGANEKYGYPFWYGLSGDRGYGQDYIIPSEILEKYDLDSSSLSISTEKLGKMGMIMISEDIRPDIISGAGKYRFLLCRKTDYESFQRSLYKL